MKDEIYIKNLDEVKKHLRLELGIFGNSLSKILKSVKIESKVPESLKLSNLGYVEDYLNKIHESIKNINGAVSKIDLKPNINVSVPDIKAPNVTVNPVVDIDLNAVIQALEPLRFLSNNPKKPLSVRMSDGKEFLEQLTQAVSRGNEQLATVVSTSYGLTKDEYLDAESRTTFGSSATNSFATVGVTSGTVIAANNSRISVSLVNDSANTIYVSKGSTAVSGSGIRLNANGGAVIIDDWKGVVSAIAGGASSNITICEVY